MDSQPTRRSTHRVENRGDERTGKRLPAVLVACAGIILTGCAMAHAENEVTAPVVQAADVRFCETYRSIPSPR